MGNAEGFELFFIQPGRRGAEPEDVDAEAAQVAPVRTGTPADGVGGPAGVSLRGEGEREAAFLPLHGQHDFRRVAHGEDGRVGGAAVRVGGDGPARSDGKPRRAGQRDAGRDAGRHDDQVGRNDFSGGETHGALFDGCRPAAEKEADAVVEQLFFKDLRHVPVELEEDLTARLDEGDIHGGAEIHRRFDADESAADDRRGARAAGLGVLPDGGGVFRRGQGEDVRPVRAGDGRDVGRRAGREDEEIIGFFIDAAARFADAHLLLFPENGRHFGIGAHVDAVLRPEAFRRHEDERGELRHRIGEGIGESTVGIGNARPLFKKDDVRRFIKTAETRRGGGAACHAADDHIFLRHGAPQSRSAISVAMRAQVWMIFLQFLLRSLESKSG